MKESELKAVGMIGCSVNFLVSVLAITGIFLVFAGNWQIPLIGVILFVTALTLEQFSTWLLKGVE